MIARALRLELHYLLSAVLPEILSWTIAQASPFAPPKQISCLTRGVVVVDGTPSVKLLLQTYTSNMKAIVFARLVIILLNCPVTRLLIVAKLSTLIGVVCTYGVGVSVVGVWTSAPANHPELKTGSLIVTMCLRFTCLLHPKSGAFRLKLGSGDATHAAIDFAQSALFKANA